LDPILEKLIIVEEENATFWVNMKLVKEKANYTEQFCHYLVSAALRVLT
jgi:hypothetical protein